jgi:phosphoribosylglycinamide formyltransferase-1
MTQPLQLAVFASGGGTNFQTILDTIDRGELTAKVKLCVSDRDDAGALDRARKHRVSTTVLPPDRFDSSRAFADQLLLALDEHDVDFIALAGYLRKIPGPVVRTFEGRMVNVHPALLPAFGGRGMYGMHVHRAVVEYGVRWTGVTVHLVDEEYDHGPVVLQQPVRVYPDDTPETVAERVLEVEHRLYPQTLQLFAEDRVSTDGRKVHISGDYPLHLPLEGDQ